MENVKKILVLAPHPDDAEFGCGGSIHKWTNEGKEIYICTFSPCLASLPDGASEDILYEEMGRSCNELGVDTNMVTHLKYPVRKFKEHRQEILEDLIVMRKDIKPDLVLTPSSHDIHQDHSCIHEESVRAFKSIRILGYELPWNNISSNINLHIKLSEKDIKAKEAAAACYSSQAHRSYTQKGFFRSLATVRGIQINTELAEGFEVIKWVI